MQILSFSNLITISFVILLCGCDKSRTEPSGQKDKSASGQETALNVTKLDSFKTAKVTEPASVREQPLSSGAGMVEEATKSTQPAGRPVTLQTPQTRSAARVAAMQEFEVLRASGADKPPGKGE